MRTAPGTAIRARRPIRRPARRLTLAAAALMLLATACTGSGQGTPEANEPTSTPGSTPTAGGINSLIPQPALPANIPVAPDSERVDLRVPTFSNPTDVTNRLFPVSQQASVLFVGHVEGKPFRTEVTLLPYTRVIDWGGQQIETLVSQYTAYLDGRLQEVAYDLYAQADDGSVWYFGEDVADLANGNIVTKEGTWLAGKDGPAQMIMPGHPQVGDVFRTENIPGIAFEQVTVKSIGQTLDGPIGPIQGGMTGEELHIAPVGTEQKIFAPGYGEFFTGGGGDVEALALAVPADALSEATPADLTALQAGANSIFDAAASEDWKTASAALEQMNTAWGTFRAGEVPRLIEPWMTRALGSLAKAVAAKDAAGAQQAAIDTARWSLDLQLRYRSPAEINLARFDLWAAQLLVDAGAGDAAAVNGDVFTLFYIRDRIRAGLAGADVTRLDTEIARLQSAGFDADLARAANAAVRVRNLVAGIEAAG